ncbi:hypothetical protein Tco_1491897 [Tanacetum coccineum]
MSTYLKNMAGYKHSQLKSKSYDEIQKLFDKEMKRVNTFVDMNSEVVKGSETRTEESSKRVGDELESDMSKKQKIDEHVEVEKDDQEEAEMKRHIEIVKDDDVTIDAIPLATKPLVIIEYQIDKDGRMGYFKLIRADGSSKSETRTEESSKRAGDELESDMSKKQKIDEHVEVEKDDQEEAEMKRHIEIVKDDEVAIDAIPLATKPPVIVEYQIDKDGRMGYFKLIRADGSSKRLEEDYERVLWGDLKVMFEPDIKSEVWRNLQGYKVTVWKLFDNFTTAGRINAVRDEIKDISEKR